MADLGKDSIRAWFEVLPDDVRAAMPDGPGAADGAEISALLKPGMRPEEALAVVDAMAESFISLGRAGRIRFLAWFSRLTYPDNAEAFRMLVDGESSSGGAGEGGVGKVAPFFMEDVRALMAALGPRAAAMIVDADTLGSVIAAGYEATNEMDMRQGGGL